MPPIEVTRQLLLCEDCTLYAINRDLSPIEDDARVSEVIQGVACLGNTLIPSSHEKLEHSIRPCDACGTRLHGPRYHFAILEEVK